MYIYVPSMYAYPELKLSLSELWWEVKIHKHMMNTWCLNPEFDFKNINTSEINL